MPDLERVYAAIHREEQSQEDLAAYLRNAHMSRIERDDEHERRLRDEIETSKQEVEAAIAARRESFRSEIAGRSPVDQAELGGHQCGHCGALGNGPAQPAADGVPAHIDCSSCGKATPVEDFEVVPTPEAVERLEALRAGLGPQA